MSKKNWIPSCPWTLHVSKVKRESTWMVKTFIKDHLCLHTRDVALCTIGWLAKEIEPIIQVNPEIPLNALVDTIQKKHQVEVSLNQMFRAKARATKKVQGDYSVQYTHLRDYYEELVRANPGTSVKIAVEPEGNPSSPTRQFKRVYICLGPLKAGFNKAGRDLLGLDGCFLKGPWPGQILTEVGVDANNGIYPFAYVVVESETTASWSWFLRCLGDDLDLPQNGNFTFITDRQKGLIPAIQQVFPNAEHRFCLRHIHENMKPRWKGAVFKNLLWAAASSTTPQKFEKNMQAILTEDKDLYNWLKEIPSKHWLRAFFNDIFSCLNATVIIS
ncbi:putative transposase, mutator type, MULE transposase domain-containing protein [Helianthus annuus]|nr:putative transposase, mutator type, MULE transposase domain-containing protein [Helianthus annuus]KAJ0536215.1 putative transposase, mutator type, MULE transposase domain-containing protein [Helianthus annuus]KAJ0543894.1 putative transposase, mutator type, MULE transposase domain-containing protein [Helianthus annuus]KAJ0708948.1 putative transposase, mutator type, MULE transposase domain-containing protein [Helianthus annuus]